jgi:hypothetical protein
MRTTDFSCAPAIGQATAQFVGATSFRGPLRVLELIPRWRRLVRRLKKSPGYCGHRVWYRFPFGFGTMAFFTDRDSLLLFARSPEHASIIHWVFRPGKAHGGFIRIYEARPQGYSSGIWRAELPRELKAIERFSPVAGEKEGPLVADPAGPEPTGESGRVP